MSGLSGFFGLDVVGVRIKTITGDTKLFRDGDYPVLRGTALILDEKNAYLWTSGYVPRLDTYKPGGSGGYARSAGFFIYDCQFAAAIFRARRWSMN